MGSRHKTISLAGGFMLLCVGMGGGKQKNKQEFSVVAIVVIVFVGTLIVLFAKVPEQVFAQSDDGVVVLSGVSRSLQSVNIKRLDGVEDSVRTVSGPIYEVSLIGDTRITDAEVVFNIDNIIDVTELVIYSFDRLSVEWKPQPTVFDLADNTISTQLNISKNVLLSTGPRAVLE